MGMAEPILKKIQEVFLEAINHPDHVEKMNEAALTIRPMVGEEYGKYIRDLHATAKVLVNIALKARQDQEK
jgi:tripartite-type tricarboxylate transporter receptor subunit TctC